MERRGLSLQMESGRCHSGFTGAFSWLNWDTAPPLFAYVLLLHAIREWHRGRRHLSWFCVSGGETRWLPLPLKAIHCNSGVVKCQARSPYWFIKTDSYPESLFWPACCPTCAFAYPEITAYCQRVSLTLRRTQSNIKMKHCYILHGPTRASTCDGKEFIHDKQVWKSVHMNLFIIVVIGVTSDLTTSLGHEKRRRPIVFTASWII